jgi:hypothetical protein
MNKKSDYLPIDGREGYGCDQQDKADAVHCEFVVDYGFAVQEKSETNKGYKTK